MKKCIKTLEIKAVEYRFDLESYDYVRNTSGCWISYNVVYHTYEEAIAVMKAAKRQIAKGMSPEIATRIISVHPVFTGERDIDRHQIRPNTPFWRRQRKLVKKNNGKMPFDNDDKIYYDDDNEIYDEIVLDF